MPVSRQSFGSRSAVRAPYDQVAKANPGQADIAPLHLRYDVKKALAADISEGRLSREQIAEQLAHHCFYRVTARQINDWTSESHSHNFPAHMIPAWCAVTGSVRLIELLASRAGFFLATQRTKDLAALGEASLAADSLRLRLTGGR